MPECHEQHHSDNQASEGCIAVTYQSAAVSVPVTVQPKVSTGHINTFCCGEPIITPSSYKITCNQKSGGCSFVLTQNICVEIPIEFSANACVDSPRIICGDISGNVVRYKAQVRVLMDTLSAIM